MIFYSWLRDKISEVTCPSTWRHGRRSSRIKKKLTRLEGYDTRGLVGVGCLFSFSGDSSGCAWTSLLNLCYRFSPTSGSPNFYVDLSLCYRFLLSEKHTMNM